MNVNNWKLQWDDGQEIALVYNLEWNFDDLVMIKSEMALSTPFSSLQSAELGFSHNIEWDQAQIFQTNLVLAMNQLKYGVELKGTK